MDFFKTLINSIKYWTTEQISELETKTEGKYALKDEIPTDDHINELINTALEEIENGTY